ncbi:MAG: metallophosphoesterase [Candidatus Aenigmatarchaeota archaeon]
MKFLKEGAVFLKKEKLLIIGDLHIGYEFELKQKGINVEIDLKEILENVIKKTSANKIVLLGDTKHSIFKPNKKEKEKLLDFFNFLDKKFEKIFVVKGNHDAFLEEIIRNEKVKIFPSRGFKYKDYGFFHGNSKPLKKVLESKVAFCSHFHVKEFETISFVISKGKPKIVILPPFNPLILGKNFEIESKFLSKLIKDYEIVTPYAII